MSFGPREVKEGCFRFHPCFGGYEVTILPFFQRNEEERKKETLVVPSSFQGKTVVRIGWDSFSERKTEALKGDIRVKKIVLPDTIQEITEKAFYRFGALEEINLPQGLLAIEEKAFYGCRRLKELSLPSSLLRIGEDAFGYCPFASFTLPRSVIEIQGNPLTGINGLLSLNVEEENPIYFSPKGSNVIFERTKKRVVSGCNNSILPEDTRIIGKDAFFGRKELHHIDLPSSLEEIEEGAFSQSGLSSLILPESVISLGESVFSGCHELKEVEILCPLVKIPAHCFKDCFLSVLKLPSSVKKIEEEAFFDCPQLTEVSLPRNITTIEDSAFGNCPLLTSIDLRLTSLIKIGKRAFSGDALGQSLSFPETLQEIGEGAFSRCKEIEDVSIPKSVSLFGKEAFASCPSLKHLFVEEGNLLYDARDNSNAIFETRSNTLIQGCTGSKIPTSTKRIADCAFLGSDIEEISFPGGLESIGNWAFTNCKKLNEVILPDSITFLGLRVFSDCRSLKTLRLSNSLISLEIGSFDGCESLEEVEIPSSLKVIRADAFANCFSLKTIKIFDTLQVLEEGTLPEEESNKPIGLENIVLSSSDAESAKILPTLQDYRKRHPSIQWITEEKNPRK